MSMLLKIVALRDEAWNHVENSEHFKAWKGLNDAVLALDVTAANNETITVFETKTSRSMNPKPKPNIKRKTKRVTQSAVAESVLKSMGEPLPVGRWLEKSIERGINIRGDDPLSNFRSTVSRDKRFYNFVRNGMYFWWLNGVELPEKWKKAEGRDLLDQPSAFVSHNQEGGEANATATI